MLVGLVRVVVAALVAVGAVVVNATVVAAAPACEDGRDPTTVRIKTIPVVPNVEFKLDGKTVRLSSKGTGSVVACRVRDASRVVGPDDPIKLTPLLRARYSRVFVTDAGRQLELAFFTDYRVGVTFIGLPTETIDSWSVKSSTGEENTYKTTTPQWMQASRVFRGADGLEERQIYQTVQTVLVNGVNVVVKNQVKFLPSQTQSVRVPLLAFDLQVYVVDRVFGYRFGRSIELVAPGRPTVAAELKNGEVELRAVPRGEYTLVASAPGLQIGRPLTVSKDQVVIVPVLSYVDIAALVGIPLVLAIALVLAPRPRLRRKLRRQLSRALPPYGRGPLTGRWTETGITARLLRRARRE